MPKCDFNKVAKHFWMNLSANMSKYKGLRLYHQFSTKISSISRTVLSIFFPWVAFSYTFIETRHDM